MVVGCWERTIGEFPGFAGGGPKDWGFAYGLDEGPLVWDGGPGKEEAFETRWPCTGGEEAVYLLEGDGDA